MNGPELFLMVFGAVLALIGVVVFFLLAWFKRTGGGRNEIQIGPVKVRLSDAPLVIFVGGVILVVLPFVLPLTATSTPRPTSDSRSADIGGRRAFPLGAIDFVRVSADRFEFLQSNINGVVVAEGATTREDDLIHLRGTKVFDPRTGIYSAELKIVSGSFMKGTVFDDKGAPARVLTLKR